MLGIGVMIEQLFGPRQDFDVEQVKNRPIEAVTVEDDTLTITFSDGSRFEAKDKGQSCCESRYMTCDDDLPSFKGDTIRKMELVDGPMEESEYGEDEVQFLRVITTSGMITVASHNEHNGYYGGFAVQATFTPAPTASE